MKVVLYAIVIVSVASAAAQEPRSSKPLPSWPVTNTLSATAAIKSPNLLKRLSDLPNNASDTYIELPDEHEPINYGQGFDSATGELKNQCIEYLGQPGELISLTDGGLGASTTAHFTHVTSSQDLAQSLKISASASFGFGLFAHADVAADFATSGTFSKYSELLIGDTKVTNSTQGLKSYRPTDLATKAAGNMADFRAKCGDSFVSSITTGGRFEAYFIATSEKSENQKAFYQAFNFATLGTKIDEATNSSLKTAEASSEVKVSILRKGGIGTLPDFNVTSLQDYVSKFPTDVAGKDSHPIQLSFFTKSYELVDGLKPSGSPTQMAALSLLSDYYGELLRRENGLRFIKDHPDAVGGEGVDYTKLENELLGLDKLLKKTKDDATSCSLSEKYCPAEDPPIVAELPDLIQWQTIDPKYAGRTPLGIVYRGQSKIAEVQGAWSPYGGSIDTAGFHEWYDVSDSDGIFFVTLIVHNIETGQDKEDRAATPHLIDCYCSVFVQLHDNHYEDNRNSTTNPLKATLYSVLYQ